MTPIQVNIDIDEEGKGLDIDIRCDKPLHISEYICILEGALAAMKKNHADAISAFEKLKASGKIVPLKRRHGT